MKKFNLVLVAAVCVASFAFFSCGEKETWTVVEEFAPDAGTYLQKMVTEITQTTETVTTSSTGESYMTVVIEGTEDDSTVTQKDTSYTVKQVSKYNSEDSYNTMKTVVSGKEGYTFDDSALTITFVQSGTNDDSTTTYAKACSEITSNGYTFEKSSLGNWRLTLTDTDSSSSTATLNVTVTFTLQ